MSFRLDYFPPPDFDQRVKTLLKVHEAFQRLSEMGFDALPASDITEIGQSGCRFSLQSELDFLAGLPLKIECFSPGSKATKWITRTLLCLLSNLGIQESFDGYYGPKSGCFAIADDSEELVEIQ